MALLQATRILSQQRIDLQDYRNIETFVCADFRAIHVTNWSDENFVMKGFIPTGTGTNELTIALAGSAAILGANGGDLYIGANSLDPIVTEALTPAATNFVEITLEQDTGGADSRAFWDKTANAGEGAEFSQIVDTFTFTRAVLSINSSNFTADPDKVRICEVDVNALGQITEIRDARNMFWRLGRPNNLDFNYSWGSRVEPLATQFIGADKNISNLKEAFDAITSRIKEIDGVDRWFETSNSSLSGILNNYAMSVLSGVQAGSKFTWTGTELLITDDSATPASSDVIGYLRILTGTENLELTRQDGPDGITMADGDVLYIQIPSPLADTVYDGVGLTSTNYQVVARGSLPQQDDVYWLAFREGSRVYLRGLGELEAGESQEINDTLSTALQTWLGFDVETATAVPYTSVPDSVIFGNTFTTNDDLVTAISANTANINALGDTLNNNAYSEPLVVVAGTPVDDNEIQFPVVVNDILTLPLDSRDGNNPEQYVVGDGILKLFLNGQLLEPGLDYNEVGTVGTLSDQVEILQDLFVGDRLTFRIDSLGGFNVGTAGAGGDVIGGANVGIGSGDVYKQKVAGVLELRRIRAGAGISVVTSGDDIIISITGGTPEPYFRADITGQTNVLVNTTQNYNLGTNKLAVYRNGVRMIPSTTAGLPVDRYQEATNNQIVLEATPTASEVLSFVNRDSAVTGFNIITGVTGTVITVPSYILASDTLKVFRNGILMNNQGAGALVDQYTETSTTSITLAQAAVATDVFLVEVVPVPSFREILSGVTGTSLTIPGGNSYSTGTGELLVYRNGILMLNSVTLGTATDRYQETSSTVVTLADPAVVSDVFEFINK